MPKKRRQAPHRCSKGQYYKMPHQVLESANYLKLTHRGRSLLHDMLLQFNGQNNGNLCAAEGLMAKRGWNKRALMSGRWELEHYRFLEITQQGGKSKVPTLYAVSFYNIQHAPDSAWAAKSDYPSDAYKTEQPRWVDPHSKKTGERERKSVEFFTEQKNRQVRHRNRTGSPVEPREWILGGKWRPTGSPVEPIPSIFRVRLVRQ